LNAETEIGTLCSVSSFLRAVTTMSSSWATAGPEKATDSAAKRNGTPARPREVCGIFINFPQESPEFDRPEQSLAVRQPNASSKPFRSTIYQPPVELVLKFL
jgi:hypothetical protein